MPRVLPRAERTLTTPSAPSVAGATLPHALQLMRAACWKGRGHAGGCGAAHNNVQATIVANKLRRIHLIAEALPRPESKWPQKHQQEKARPTRLRPCCLGHSAKRGSDRQSIGNDPHHNNISGH